MTDKRSLDIPAALLLITATTLFVVASIDRIASLHPALPDVPAAIVLAVVSVLEMAVTVGLCFLLPWRSLRFGWPIRAAAAAMAILVLLRPLAIAGFTHRLEGGLSRYFLLTDYHASGSLPIPMPIAIAWLVTSTAGWILLTMHSSVPRRPRFLLWMAATFGISLVAVLLFPTFPTALSSSFPPPPYPFRWLRGWNLLLSQDARIPMAADVVGKVLMSLALAYWSISRHQTSKPVLPDHLPESY